MMPDIFFVSCSICSISVTVLDLFYLHAPVTTFLLKEVKLSVTHPGKGVRRNACACFYSAL